MLELPSVTLSACASSIEYFAPTLRAINRCLSVARFRNVVIATSDPSAFNSIVADFIRIEPFSRHEDASLWTFAEWPQYTGIYGSHALCIGWDGFILNADSWRSGFLDYDYIGAPWPSGEVGNGGFALISRRFIETIKTIPIEPGVHNTHPSDGMLCSHSHDCAHGYRGHMEAHGIKYAPRDVADRFSVEGGPYESQFGFHGVHTLADVFFKGLIS